MICVDALLDQVHEFNHLRTPDVLVTEHKIVAERPGLSIEDSLLFALVVDGRVVPDAEQSLERDKFVVAQQENVMRYRIAKRDLVVLHIKTRIDLCESFL